MKLCLLRRRRIAGRVAWVVLLSLLFQYVAVAAYACPVVSATVQAVESTPDCVTVEKQDRPLLCEQHCEPDDSTTPELRVAQVPPVVLPPARFDLVRSPPACSLEHYRSVPALAVDPPPTVRFCSLLI